MSISETIDRFLEEGLDGYIAETSLLCAQPSVSARGEGVAACADLVAQMLLRRGFEVERCETPGQPVILGRYKGRSERTLLCYNHYDVQPPEPLDLWTTPPFEPDLRGGKLFARGAKDDKGEFVTRLAAFDAVRRAHGGEMPCGVTFVVEGEEEIGSPNIVGFVEKHFDKLKSHGAIWEEGGTTAEGQPILWLGCRGVLALELSVKTMTKDAHSGGAHILPNAAWRLVYALKTLRDEGGRVRIPGFYEGVIPVTELDKAQLASLPEGEEELRESFGLESFVGGLAGDAFREAVFNPTCNIQGIETGYTGEGMKTVIPADARAKLDFRLVPGQDPDDIFEKLKSHLAAEGFGDIVIKRYGAMWPYKAEGDDPFIRLAQETGREVYGQESLVYPLVGGSSPVYAFNKPLGIPVVTAGLGYGRENRTHAPDEHIRLEDFLKASKHIARIMAGFADLV